MNNTSYQLREIVVSPDQLLLDPNNPRLQQKANQPIKYRPEILADGHLQERVRQALLDKEHSVSRLVDSIKEHGFVNIDSIFVKRIPSINKYLVLEGNRRTTAIKTILHRPNGVKPTSLGSLTTIPVKELICEDDNLATEMTEFILSIRHIFGVKEWAPMQKAHSIYAAYFERYKQSSGNTKFRYVPSIAAAFAPTMNLKPNEVGKAVAIYSVFSQLQHAEYSVKSDHYSLIEMMISRPKMAAELFDFDRIGCSLSEFGMELFNDLCIKQGCEITNPKKFRLLYNIWKEGGLHLVEEVAQGGNSVEKVDARIKLANSGRAAETKLTKIKTALEQIEISQLKGTPREKKLVNDILELINGRIIPILQ